METVIRTGIRLTGDASGMNAAFSGGEKSVKSLNREVAAASKGAKTLTGELGAVGGGLTKVASAIAGWQMGRVIISTADDMTVLQSRLKLVTNNSNELAYVQQRLFGIAQQSRVNYGELGATYAQIARAAGDLGVSQGRLLGVTQSIGQAMAIGGGSAQSMQAALTQLSQGLASGTLRGEELNSILEQTPRLAQAIAQGMGVSLGALRALGQDGKLTALTVIEALEKAAPALKREFDQVTPTIGGAFTTLKNSSGQFIAELDKATGSSKSLSDGLTKAASMVTDLGRTIGTNANTINLLGSAATWAAGFGVLAVSLGRIGPAVMGIGAVLLANPAVLALLGIGAAVGGMLSVAGRSENKLAYAKNELDRITKTLDYYPAVQGSQEARHLKERQAVLREQVKQLQGELAVRDAAALPDAESSALRETRRLAEREDPNRAPFPGAKPLDEVRKYAKLAVDVQREAYDQSVDIAKSYQNRIKLATSDEDKVKLTREMNARLVQVDKDTKKELKAISEQGAAEAKALAEAQFGLQRAQLEKSGAIERLDLEQRQRTNEQLYKLGLLDVDEYYQRRADLGLQDIAISTRLVEAELAQARAVAASTRRAEDKAQAQARVLGLEKELIELGGKRTATAAEPVNQRDLRIKEEQDRLNSEASAARRAANVRAYDEAQRLEQESRALRIGAIKDPAAQARAQLDADLKQRRETMLNGVTSDDARQQVTDRFNEYAILKNEDLAEKMKPGWQRLVEGWSDTSRLMRETFDSTMDGVVRAGEDAFVQFAQTGKITVKGMVDVVIAEMARMVYRNSFAGPLASLLSSGLGAIFGDTTQLATGDFARMDRLTAVNHSGGIAGVADAAFRPVDRSVFAGAPRFHSGGIAGNEVPIIALRGEGIFTREQMAALAPAGVGQQPVTVNVFNHTGSQVDVQQKQSAGGGLQIDVFVMQLQDVLADNVMAGSGALSRAFEARYGMRTAIA